MNSADSRPSARNRNLVAVVVIAASAIVVGPLVAAAGHDHVAGEIDSQETLVRVATIPAVLFATVALVGVAVFGSWTRVWFDDRPARPWVWGVAVALVTVSLIGIDYGNLVDAGPRLTLLLVFTSLLLAFGWELLFRGFVVDALRTGGFDELRMAMVSSALYGAVHLLTVATDGLNTVVHVVVMSLLGLVFYALRRVSGSLLLPTAAHGLIEFAFRSAWLGDHPGDGLGTGLAVLVASVLAVVVIVRRHVIEPPEPTAAEASGPATRAARSGLVWAGRVALVLLALVTLAAVVPFSGGDLSAQPSPTSGFEDAMERFRDIEDREADLDVYEPCRSQVFDHGERAEVAVVLFHGLTNCPRQFVEFGRRLHADGANVVILRAPHHGLSADGGRSIGGVDLVGDLSARDLRDWGDESVDIAAGLGDQVQVLGLSMGGAMTMWAGQFRDDVDLAVVVAPGVSIPVGPRALTTGFVNAFNRLPNFSVPTGGDRLDHAYYGGSTGALAALLLLARATESDIADQPAAATEAVVVLNPNDDQVDNDDVRRLVEDWDDGDVDVEVVMVPDVGLPHDLIDPAAPGGDIELVYPFLIDLLQRSWE